MTEVLVLATAGLKPGQLKDTDHVCYPRVDYLELRRHLDVKIINYDIYDHSKIGSILRFGETQLRSDVYLTYLGILARRSAKTVFAMSERAGIPFSGFLRLSQQKSNLVSMFQSWSWRQEVAISSLKLLSQMNYIAVHCKSMEQKITELGASPETVQIVPYSIDQKFFSPAHGVEQQPAFIFTIGEPRSRNYPLLFQAVNSLPVKVIAATSGMWYAREKKRQIKSPIPENVNIVKNLPLRELRKFYSQSSFVVLPVYKQISSAGATGTLEAACMERAVIATRSPGLNEFVVDGQTGILVEPDDPDALKDAIQYLLSHPEEAQRMGKNARQRVEEIYNLDNYVESLARLISKSL